MVQTLEQTVHEQGHELVEITTPDGPKKKIVLGGDVSMLGAHSQICDAREIKDDGAIVEKDLVAKVAKIESGPNPYLCVHALCNEARFLRAHHNQHGCLIGYIGRGNTSRA